MGQLIDYKDIRSLPDGSIIRQYSLDKYKRPQRMDITVHHTEDGSVKYYRDADEVKLRDFKVDTYHYYELLKRGDKP